MAFQGPSAAIDVILGIGHNASWTSVPNVPVLIITQQDYLPSFRIPNIFIIKDEVFLYLNR